MENFRFLFVFFIIIYSYNDSYANKNKTNNYWLGVWNYKFEFIKCIPSFEEFEELQLSLNISKNNLTNRNQYLKENLSLKDSFYYVILLEDTLNIHYLNQQIKNIKVYFEWDYKAYWNQMIGFQNFNFYKKDTLKINHVLFSSIKRNKEILPDGHWFLYCKNDNKNEGIVMETRIKDGFFDKFLIFYDDNDKFKLKELYSIKNGYLHGISYIKLLSNRFAIRTYNNGIELQYITNE